MRYALSQTEWSIIQPILPSKLNSFNRGSPDIALSVGI